MLIEFEHTIESRWRKSSLSGNQTACVELASPIDQIRDSKDPEHILPVPTLSDLLQAIRKGNFDR